MNDNINMNNVYLKNIITSLNNSDYSKLKAYKEIMTSKICSYCREELNKCDCLNKIY
jgi:hypothetical protein